MREPARSGLAGDGTYGALHGIVNTMVRTAEVAPAPSGCEVLPVGAKAGPWIVEYELGRGGMGAVYAVVHEEIGKRAALKVVHSRLVATGFNADRMLLEAKVVNQVDHPNIVDIFETGRLADGRPYIVMERLEGQSLAQRVQQAELRPDQVIAILLQIADALIAAHAAGIVHRDLKLDNVFLVHNPEDPCSPHVKVLDWGIAKDIVHDVRNTAEGTLVGTPQYLSPEQACGKPVSPQTDVYSLGVMAYELFLEELPFVAETAAEIMTMHLRATPRPASELWPDIPPALEQLLHAMLAKSSDVRPSMLAVARSLEAVRPSLSAPGKQLDTPPPAATASRMLAPGAGIATAAIQWRSGRRWQWVIGVFAIVASASMFLVSRVDDVSATPATDVVLVPAISERFAITPRSASTALEVPPPPPDPEPAVTEASKRTRAHPAPRRVSHRKVPTAPRRLVTHANVEPPPLDPDGTLDPYR
jgi:serine/threonine-protein kinase